MVKFVTKLAVEIGDGGEKEITVVARIGATEAFEASDVATILGIIEEVNETTNFDGGRKAPGERDKEDGERGAERSRRRRARHGEEEPEETPEEEEAPKRRRRAAKEEEAPKRRRRAAKEETPEEEEAPKRRRRAAKEEEPEVEEEAPKRRRRAAKEEEPEDDGPTQEDVAKAASEAAEALGAKITGEIIMDYSEDGTIRGIPAAKRQAFIDEINEELGD